MRQSVKLARCCNARRLRPAGHQSNLLLSSKENARMSFEYTTLVAKRRKSSGPAELLKTPLYDLHVKSGGKMVPFAEYSMPVQYSDLSALESHKWTRTKASLFDVGHMVQHHISGQSATKLLNKITPTSLNTLKPFTSTLSCLLLPTTGGIVDDTVITRLGPDEYYMVTNAACRKKDIAFIASEIKANGFDNVKWEILDGWGLIALQGPASAQILKDVLAGSASTNLDTVYFGQCFRSSIDLGMGQTSKPVLITRGGYTGEDGFEISINPSQTVDITRRLLESAGLDQLRWAGLGARDSLRLEAGMCLYGHDLDENITPVEAGLSWIIGKDRREDLSFNGAEKILKQLVPKKSGGTGVERRRVGLTIQGAPAREGALIVDADNVEIGKITSGCPSPSLSQNIAMGYVKQGWHKSGTEIGVIVRGKRRSGLIAKMPFVPSKFWRKQTGPAS